MPKFKFSNLKSQSWSIDIVIGIIVFMAAFLIAYSVINSNKSSKSDDLKGQGLDVIKEVASSGSLNRIIDDNEINITRLNQLKNLSYDELKRQLRIEGDFCIYLEDDKGNLVLLNNSYRGIGAPTINISGTPCSQK